MGTVIRWSLDRLRGFWRDGLPRNSPAAYFFAFGCIGITLLARVALSVFIGGVGLFTIYFPAVLGSSLVGGAEAGTVALFLGGIAGWAGIAWHPVTPIVPALTQGIGS